MRKVDEMEIEMTERSFMVAMIAIWRIFLRACLSAIIVMGAGSQAFAGKWFMHEFGELRAYHQDWLAVCADAGKGACRIVQLKVKADDTFFGDGRLTVNEGDPESNPWIELVVMDGLEASEPLTVIVDGQTLATLEPQTGYMRDRNTINAYIIDEAKIVGRLLPAMRAGRYITFDYALANGGRQSIQFSLRGVTAAWRAVQRRIAQR